MKEIKLTQGKVALVDDEDYKELSKHKWHARRGTTGVDYFYAARNKKENGKYKVFFMHQQIMNTPKGMHTDHINHDTLDNRRKNLRICTASQNQMNQSLSKANKSGITGVFWNKRNNKWCAQINVNRKHIALGHSKHFKVAAYMRFKAEIKYFGEYKNKLTDEQIKDFLSRND